MGRRLVSEKEAVEETGIPLATFRSWVEIGRLPKPLPDIDKYDMKAIDQAIDRISGLGSGGNALDAWRARGTNAR
jgi:hypothetical protein